MSLTAGFVILAVMLLRLPLKKVPKVFSYALRSLYALSARNSALLSPLAFGEAGVKARIRNVLHFRKPARWVSAAAAVIVCAAGLALATSACSPVSGPIDPDDPSSPGGNYIFDRLIYMNPGSCMITGEMKEYYHLSQSMLTIIRQGGELQYVAISMDEKRPLDRQGFADLFYEEDKKPDLSRYRDCWEYPLCENGNGRSYRLYLLDKDIWLAQLYSRAPMWSIYKIKKYSGALPEAAHGANPVTYEWSDTISMPIPAPAGAEAFSISDGDGAVYCRGVGRKDLDQYIQLLEGGGWRLLPRDGESSLYMLSRGNDLVALADETYAEDYNAIRVSYSPGYSGPEGGGRRAIEEAASIIQSHLDSLEASDIYGYGRKFYSARETDSGDAYDSMGLQAFEVYGDEGYAGRFVIGKNGAILDLGFAGEMRTADIDGDGEMELITLGAWGSGIYRIEVAAYKYSGAGNSFELAYGNRWIPEHVSEEDCWNMSLVKIDDHTIHLYGADLVAGRFLPKVDYGKLRVEGSRLVPAEGDFPFSEWGPW